MAEKSSAFGHVKEWTPAEGNQPGKGVVGGIRFSIFPTDYKTKEPNAVYTELLKTIENGGALKAKFFISKKGDYENYILDDYMDAPDDAPEVLEGDKKEAPAAPKRGKKDWVPKDESWLAARWAFSVVLDGLGDATVDLKKVSKQAEELALASLALAGKLKAAQAKTAGAGANNAGTADEQKDDVPF